jgi:phosphoribosylaminoimidazole (AIR) synthetase
MRRTFNMGVGLVVVCAVSDADRVLDMVKGEGAWIVGHIVPGDRQVVYA